MADTPEITPEAKALAEKQAAIQAWHDSNSDEKKTAAVKKFPILVELYALAANFVTKESE